MNHAGRYLLVSSLLPWRGGIVISSRRMPSAPAMVSVIASSKPARCRAIFHRPALTALANNAGLAVCCNRSLSLVTEVVGVAKDFFPQGLLPLDRYVYLDVG